jgi:hypothetical protein
MWILTVLLVTTATATDRNYESNVTSLYKCCGSNSSFGQDLATDVLEFDMAVSQMQDHGSGVQVRHGFPESCNKTSIVLNQSIFLPVSPYSVDKVEPRDTNVESASVVGCECHGEDSGRSINSPTVVTVKKCCVNGTYDPTAHICREVTDGQNILEKVTFQDTVCFANVEFGLSKCHSSQALVDTVVDGDQIKLLQNGTVLLNTSNGILVLEDNAFCIDSVVNRSNSVVVKFCESVDTACTQSPCVQKCCPDGYGMIESKSCKRSDFDFNPQFYNIVSTNGGFELVEAAVPSFAILSNLECDKFILRPESTEGDFSYLEVDGRLYVPKHADLHLTTDKYCLEKVIFSEDEMEGIYTFLCFPEDEMVEDDSLQFTLCSLGLITSSVFLFATFLVYACLPSLQNLHGKTLMCHVASLFAAYVCLSIAQLGGENLDLFLCAAVGESRLKTTV